MMEAFTKLIRFLISLLKRILSALTDSYLHIGDFNPSEHIVIVTGCDSGFGFEASLRLSQQGFLVAAACLTSSGVERIRDSVATALQCDVTKEKDVSDLQRVVEKLVISKKAKVWAIINNAGIAPSGFVDWAPMDNIHKVMDVNYFGLVLVTKACLQFLKQTKHSRIINVGSMAGLAGFPGGGGYCSSKHAVEGFAKCLYQELAPWNIYVANINPGFMKTPLIAGSFDSTMKDFRAANPAITNQYPERNINILRNMIERIQEDPKLVVDKIVSLVTIRRPTLTNGVGWQSFLMRWAMWITPTWIRMCIEETFIEISGYGPYPSIVDELQQPKSRK